jgi:hypothetical protein
VTISVCSADKLEAYIEYGFGSGDHPKRTPWVDYHEPTAEEIADAERWLVEIGCNRPEASDPENIRRH